MLVYKQALYRSYKNPTTAQLVTNVTLWGLEGQQLVSYMTGRKQTNTLSHRKLTDNTKANKQNTGIQQI